ncbi:MAG: PorV/PorQ family protein [Flavicella sp.]
MRKHIFYLLLITYYFGTAQEFRKYSNEFLTIGVDAAAMGMSKSVTASSKDVNAIYWNPAGLAGITVNQGALMHSSYFAGIANYDYAAAAIAPKLEDGPVLAFSLIRFGVDNIQNTTNIVDNEGNIDFNRIERFSTADYALQVAFAKSIPQIKGLAVGINAKIVRRIIGDFASSWGIGLDAGIQYKLKRWQLGLMVRDITTTFNAWNFDETRLQDIQDAVEGQNQTIPEKIELTLPKVHFGIARDFTFKNEKFHLLTELNLHARLVETNDIVSTRYGSMTPSLGFQVDFQRFVFLRFGVGEFQKVREIDTSESLRVEPNIGLGFNYHGVQVDYALTNIASFGNALYSNTFSVKIDFDFLQKKSKK